MVGTPFSVRCAFLMTGAFWPLGTLRARVPRCRKILSSFSVDILRLGSAENRVYLQSMRKTTFRATEIFEGLVC